MEKIEKKRKREEEEKRERKKEKKKRSMKCLSNVRDIPTKVKRPLSSLIFHILQSM